MKIVINEKKKYRHFSTRYDLNYWYQTPERFLEIQSWKLESDIKAVKKNVIRQRNLLFVY